jgi:hypothetical protein
VNIRTVPSNSPVTDVTSNDIRCNVNGTSGGSTTTATVAAGSTVRFYQFVYHVQNKRLGCVRRSVLFWTTLCITKGLWLFTWVSVPFSARVHFVILSLWLGKAPSSASSWDGSGANWFKIYELGATFDPFVFLAMSGSISVYYSIYS